MKINNAEEKQAISLAKKYIRKKPMPCSLENAFKKHWLGYLLDDIYIRTAELIQDNQDANKALMTHLQQILPCIAFYEALLVKEGSKDKALAVVRTRGRI